MSDWRLHTPVGVNDILPSECAKKHEIENTLTYIFTSMGYRQVETPGFEYYDAYSEKGGTISQENMFKFFDEKGRILVLRPDITTGVARMTATKGSDCELPRRYCYTGNVYRAMQTEGARQREVTQSGIELIGSGSPSADAEVVAAVIEGVIALGIDEFHVELGQVSFFNGLAEQAGLDGEQIEKLRARIDAKDKWGITELTKKLDIDDRIKDLMIHLPYMFGGTEIFERADVAGLNKKSADALDNLRAVYELLVKYGFEKYVSMDLGMLQSINYYTGLIFKCYTHGVGFPICAGGRYDKLVGRFGADLPAVGAAFRVNRILSILKEDSEDDFQASTVFAEAGAEGMAYDLSYTLRFNGCIVDSVLDETNVSAAREAARAKGRSAFLQVCRDGRLIIDDFIKNTVTESTVEEFLNLEKEDSEL